MPLPAPAEEESPLEIVSSNQDRRPARLHLVRDEYMAESFKSGMSGMQIGETLRKRVQCLPVYTAAPAVSTLLFQMLVMMCSDLLRPPLVVDAQCCAVYVCDFMNRVRWADVDEVALALFMSSSAFHRSFGIWEDCIHLYTRRKML